MLILAGVSINAIVGDNGVLTKTTYASFLSEMSAVEEAVQMWKAGEIIEAQGDEVKAIPANGLCKANDVTSAERLVGEVGFYRVWSLTSTMPSIDILSSADNFNSSFESELVFYPAGVQDLYYLNNDALEIKGNKTYLIDATTGMIYSMTGISLKGVRCYSLNMAKAVMNGTIEQPLFAEAEVSGTGSGEKFAGNVQDEFLPDGTPNPDYNPYGFQIIADWRNNNVYKLYNNGDLYGKGLKGTLLNTPESEMQNINANIWQEFEIPEIIPNINGKAQIISGYYTIYVIDSEGYLWAWGDNSYNKLGLSKEEQIEYTGKVPIKLDVNGKKVYKVYPNMDSTYVVTKSDNDIYELYACGYNTNGELGIGNLETSQEAFTKVEFDHPEQIISIASPNYFQVHWSMILADRGLENKIYFSGGTDNSGEGNVSLIFKGTDKENTNIVKYTEIFNDVYGTKFETNIKDMIRYKEHKTAILFIDENDNLINFSGGKSQKLDFGDTNNSIEKVVVSENPGVMIRKNTSGEREVWAFTRRETESVVWGFGTIGEGFRNITEYVKAYFDPNDIKDIYSSEQNCFFILNNGKVWAVGQYLGTGSGLSSGSLNEFTCINDISNLPLIDSIICNNNNFFTSTGSFCFKGKDGNLYSTGNNILMFGENILQKSWTKIATNVKKFNATTYADCLAYIDKNNDIWICGADSWLLGTNTENVEKISNFKLLKEYLKDEEIYDNINGKVEDYYFDCANFFIKTNDDDNDSLYGCGYYNAGNWTEQYLGLGINVSTKIPTLILENVKDFYVGRASRWCIMNDGSLQCWGSNNGSQLSGIESKIPVEYTQDDMDFSNVKKIYSWAHGSNMFMNDGTVYVTGQGIKENDTNGLGYDIAQWTLFPQDELILNDSIKQLAYVSRQSKIYLTEKGNLWGTGILKTLGIGSTSSSIDYNLFAINNIDNVSEIVGGNGFYILIKKDGTVWGTGSNVDGILGRWIGVDRNTPNSRYKTAFEWVECPELEI